MPDNTIKRSEKEEFLDDYFLEQLQKVIKKIGSSEISSRKDHVEYIYDLLMSIADEYQAVMIEQEQGYWDSIEMWNDEFQQQEALRWVNDSFNKGDVN